MAGVLAFTQLPVAPLPQVDVPDHLRSAPTCRARAPRRWRRVATPLERQFGRIAGVTEMTSSSGLGSTNVTLQFECRRDMDAAARDVQAAINAARGQLPANLPSNPNYRKVNPADAPVIILALTSDTVPRSEIYDIASTVLAQEICAGRRRRPGQRRRRRAARGARRAEPDVLNKYGISLEQVRTVLGQANANRPKGQVADAALELGDPRQRSAVQGASTTCRSSSRRATAPSSGSPTSAQVTDSVENVRIGGLANGKPACWCS